MLYQYLKLLGFIFLLLIIGPCSQKLAAPTSEGNGILVVPQGAEDISGGLGTLHGFPFYYMLEYYPKKQVKIEIRPALNEKYTIIQNFPPGSYVISAITMEHNPAMGKANPYTKQRSVSPIFFNIEANKITLLGSKIVTKRRAWAATTYQSYNFCELNDLESSTILNKLKNLENFELWEICKAANLHEKSIEKTQLIEVQNLLIKLGYSPGPADGNINPKTERAVREFQKNYGMNADGKISRELLDEMRRKSKEQNSENKIGYFNKNSQLKSTEMDRLLAEIPVLSHLKEDLSVYYVHASYDGMPIWDNRIEAYSLLKMLRTKVDSSADINYGSHGKFKRYTVFFGPFTTKLEAVRMAKRIKGAGFTFFVKFTPNP